MIMEEIYFINVVMTMAVTVMGITDIPMDILMNMAKNQIKRVKSLVKA